MLSKTAIASLIVQLVAGIFGLAVLSFAEVGPESRLLMGILKLEMIVQVVEFCFYSWLVLNIMNKGVPTNITAYRYLDWALTTPVMLVSTAVYFRYRSGESRSFATVVGANRSAIGRMVAANGLMLLVGFLAETNYLDLHTGVALGFVPFIVAFTELYKFAAASDSTSRHIFWAMLTLWSSYGFAAVLDFESKNSLYNVIDVFSKNFYGTFLAMELIRASARN